DGGYEDQKVNSSESSRKFTPGDMVTVVWSDVNSEQERDLVLIVIGTLIGVGVAMFVEALRLTMEPLLLSTKTKRGPKMHRP
ncbi:MAG TPA: hypothetical protein VF447_13080, partial [Terriglobales bacterium]